MYRNKTLPGAGAPAGEYGHIPGQTAQGPAGPPAIASLPGAPGPGFILYEFELNLTVIR